MFANVRHVQAGRLKLVESHASVYVRVCDSQRMGSVEGPANEAGAQAFLQLPPYVQDGSRVQSDMQTMRTGGRTYDNARCTSQGSSTSGVHNPGKVAPT